MPIPQSSSIGSTPPTGTLLYSSVLLYAVFLYTAYFLLALLIVGCIFDFFLQRLAEGEGFGSVSGEEVNERSLEKGLRKDRKVLRGLEERGLIVDAEAREKWYGIMIRVREEAW